MVVPVRWCLYAGGGCEDLDRTSQSRSRSCSMMLSSVDDVFPILFRLIPIYGLKRAFNVAQWSRGKILALGGFPRMQGIPGSNPGWAPMFLKNSEKYIMYLDTLIVLYCINPTWCKLVQSSPSYLGGDDVQVVVVDAPCSSPPR